METRVCLVERLNVRVTRPLRSSEPNARLTVDSAFCRPRPSRVARDAGSRRAGFILSCTARTSSCRGTGPPLRRSSTRIVSSILPRRAARRLIDIRPAPARAAAPPARRRPQQGQLHACLSARVPRAARGLSRPHVRLPRHRGSSMCGFNPRVAAPGDHEREPSAADVTLASAAEHPWRRRICAAQLHRYVSAAAPELSGTLA
jgi:hypothetical protein